MSIFVSSSRLQVDLYANVLQKTDKLHIYQK